MNDNRRIAFLLKYLYENTDMDHTVTSVELSKILQDQGLAADKRTIRKEAEILADVGYDILINDQPGVPTEYSYGSRDWDKTELMILIDAVASAQFITQAKTEQLIAKLSALAGKHLKDSLIPKVYVSEHVKAENEKLLYVIEKIAQGIQEKKKIAFRRFVYNTNKKPVPRDGGKAYVFSPYNTVWKEDRYYVVGYSDSREMVVSIRVDRMEIPEILEEDAVPQPDDYNVQDYTDTVTKMYGGPKTKVTLRCRKELINNIIDKFGKGVKISNVTPISFDVTATVELSVTFLGWLFQYAGEMTILSPASAQDKYIDMIHAAVDDLNAIP